MIAKQSSVYMGHDASRAIDGNTGGDWNYPNQYDSSIISTESTQNPWWQVDLGSTRDISSITVYNRVDCCMQQLDTAIVFLSDIDLDNSTDIEFNKSAAGTWTSLVCDSQIDCETSASTIETTYFFPGTKARYVRIQLNTTDYLQFAEVVITGNTSSFASPFNCGTISACLSLTTHKTPTRISTNNPNSQRIPSDYINRNRVPIKSRTPVR